MINHYDNESRLTAILRCVVDQTADAAMLLQLGPARTREEIFISRALGKKPWAAIPPRTTLEMWLAFIAEDAAEPAPGSYTVRSCAESCIITYARRVKGSAAIVPIFPPHDPYEIALAKLAGILPVSYGVQGRTWELLINQLAEQGPRKNISVIYGSAPKREGDHITYMQDLHGHDRPWPAGGGKNLFGGAYGERFTFAVPILSGTTISVSGSIPASGNTRCNMYDANGARVQNFGLNGTINGRKARNGWTLATDVYSVMFDQAEASDLQIELGPVATPFAPYSNNCPILPGLSLILDDGSRLDVYDGEIDWETGHLISTMAEVDLGSLSWGYVDSYSSFHSTGVADSKPHGPNETGNIITSNGLTPIGCMSAGAADYTIVLNCASHTENSLYVKDPRYTDAEQFKAAMSGVKMVYELAEPVTVQLSPAELQRARGCTKYLGVGTWKLCPGVMTAITARLTTSEATTHYDIAPSVADGWSFDISVDDQTATGATGALSVGTGEHSVTITATPAAGAAACFIHPTLYSEEVTP